MADGLEGRRAGAASDLGAADRSQRRSRVAAVGVIAAGIYLARCAARPLRRAAKAGDAVAAAQKSSRELADRNELLVERCAEAERTTAVAMTQQLLAVDLISTVGYDGHFKSLNPAWERTLGFTAAELMSRPFLDFLHPDDVESTMAEYANLLATGADTIYFLNRYPTKAGGWRWLEWHVRPDPEHQLLYCVARDTTERKEADRELAVAQRGGRHGQSGQERVPVADESRAAHPAQCHPRVRATAGDGRAGSLRSARVWGRFSGAGATSCRWSTRCSTSRGSRPEACACRWSRSKC